MNRRFPVLLFVAIGCSLGSQNESLYGHAEDLTDSHCELRAEDYEVFTALMHGLHGPEDPEEAWEGKDMLVMDATVAPANLKSEPAGWGFRSPSKAAPSPETFHDFAKNSQAVCTISARFAESEPFKIVPHSELDRLFKKGIDKGWHEFYRRHPNSAGYWQISRPGYNVAHDEALLYVSHSCGGLCGTGHLYLLSKESGRWGFKNRLMLWIS